MNLLFDLSKEHNALPILEITSLFQTYHIPFSIVHQDENVFIITLSPNRNILSILAKRLAYTYSISEYLFTSSINKKDIIQQSNQHPIKNNDSIAIRYKNRSTHQDSQHIIKLIASVYTNNRKVDLTNPTNELNVIITDDVIYVGRLLYTIDRKKFEKRKVQFRPFFSPISLHPRIARALVNISMIKKNDTILDPFCGTGGFLIEAGLIGCRVFGSDIQWDMIEGTKQNLNHYHIHDYTIFKSDIALIQHHLKEPVDSIVTDAPYGKSTTTKKESLESLYTRTFHSITSLLRDNGSIVIGLPKKNFSKLFSLYFSLEHIISIPVHRSLTRYFYVGKKSVP